MANPYSGRALSADEWEDAEIPRPPWLIPGLLAVGESGMIHAKYESYKTFLALQMALDLSTPRPVLDVFDAPMEPLRTLLIQAEGSVWNWQQRIVKMRQGRRGQAFTSVHQSRLQVDTKAGAIWLRGLLKEHQPHLLILDPVKSLFDGDDSDANAVQRWIRNLNEWREEFEVSELLLHHNRQAKQFATASGIRTYDGGAEEARGRTELPAWSDFVMGMRRVGKMNDVEVTVEKTRDHKRPGIYHFRFDEEAWRLVPTERGQELVKAIKAALKDGTKVLKDVKDEVSEVLGVGVATVQRAITDMIGQGEVEQKQMAGKGKKVYVLSLKEAV